MDVLIQAGAEPVDEGDHSDPCSDEAAAAMFAQAGFHEMFTSAVVILPTPHPEPDK